MTGCVPVASAIGAAGSCARVVATLGRLRNSIAVMTAVTTNRSVGHAWRRRRLRFHTFHHNRYGYNHYNAIALSKCRGRRADNGKNGWQKAAQATAHLAARLKMKVPPLPLARPTRRSSSRYESRYAPTAAPSRLTPLVTSATPGVEFPPPPPPVAYRRNARQRPKCFSRRLRDVDGFFRTLWVGAAASAV